MYLIPRLVGVFTYFVITIFFFLLIRKSNKSKLNIILLIYALILAIIGFFYVPSESADLSRIWDTMRDFSTSSMTELSEFALSTNIPTFYFFIYMISWTDLYNLLPAIVAFIFYINSFYIIKDYAQKKNFSSKTIALTVFIFMCFGQFLQVISGIRSLLAFSIIARCVYNEYINNKSILKNLIWYIIAATLHPAALAIILIHLIITLAISGKISKVKKVLIVLIMILILIFGQSFLDEMISAANSYLTEESYSYIWEYIMAIAYLFLLLITIIDANKTSLALNTYKKYIIVFIIITSLFISVYSIFQRYTVFISVLASPLFMETINKYECKENDYSQYKSKKYLQLIFLGSLAILVLACARGNLSGLKFFI